MQNPKDREGDSVEDAIDQEIVEDKSKMPRPKKRRRLQANPSSNYFKPAGIPKKGLQEVVLTSEEFEAIKLIDLDKLPQSEAATKMQISQPTLSRILQSARNKIADSIINGKALKIKEFIKED